MRTVVRNAVDANEASLADMQARVDRAFKLLVPAPTDNKPSEAQLGFARRLSAGARGQSLAEWIAGHSDGSNERRNKRLDSALAEIETPRL